MVWLWFTSHLWFNYLVSSNQIFCSTSNRFFNVCDWSDAANTTIYVNVLIVECRKPGLTYQVHNHLSDTT